MVNTCLNCDSWIFFKNDNIKPPHLQTHKKKKHINNRCQLLCACLNVFNDLDQWAPKKVIQKTTNYFISFGLLRLIKEKKNHILSDLVLKRFLCYSYNLVFLVSLISYHSFKSFTFRLYNKKEKRKWSNNNEHKKKKKKNENRKQ